MMRAAGILRLRLGKVPAVILVTSLTLTVAVSCKKEQPKPVVQKQAQKVEVAPAPSKPAAIKEEKGTEAEVYTYNPKGRRDPLLSIIEASKRERESDKRKKSLKPSESYDIADIKVIAIARDRSRYYAMIQLPDKKYFTVKEGMALGIHGGTIVRIDDIGVTVREYIKDYKGEIQPKDIQLRLRKEEVE